MDGNILHVILTPLCLHDTGTVVFLSSYCCSCFFLFLVVSSLTFDSSRFPRRDELWRGRPSIIHLYVLNLEKTRIWGHSPWLFVQTITKPARFIFVFGFILIFLKSNNGLENHTDGLRRKTWSLKLSTGTSGEDEFVFVSLSFQTCIFLVLFSFQLLDF